MLQANKSEVTNVWNQNLMVILECFCAPKKELQNIKIDWKKERSQKKEKNIFLFKKKINEKKKDYLWIFFLLLLLTL